ncbi:MAG: phosphoribosylanthranilate isomerase [Magnetococcales bacterium]|nr:phosphoribosylanthranilate isomerase [Magnetococcales bacterium]
MSRDPPHRVRIKVCGITRREDAWAAIDAGVDALGLVFYSRSPRSVSIAQARGISRHLPPFVQLIGLFVNEKVEVIQTISREVGLDGVQLHGEESPEFCRMVPGRIIKALRVAAADDMVMAQRYQVSAILYDSKVSGVQGGSGCSFDWSLLQHHPEGCPLILAGGLNPGNVAGAMAQVRPYAVDVSSGVESSPGIKNRDLIRQFVRAVQEGLGRGEG